MHLLCLVSDILSKASLHCVMQQILLMINFHIHIHCIPVPQIVNWVVLFNSLLTARPSTDSIELLPFSSFFKGFVNELESEKITLCLDV